MIGPTQNKTKWFAGVLLLAFVSFYANTTLFQHSHIINGVTIVHSHIHGASHHSSQSGNHTSSEITLIAHLSDFEASAAEVMPSDLNVQLIGCEFIYGEFANQYTPIHLTCVSLRAPPAYSI